MKKALFLLLLCCSILLGCTACGNAAKDANAPAASEAEAISMSVDTRTLTPQGASFTLRNNTGTPYIYGAEYRIEKQENNTWRAVETDGEMMFTAIGYLLNAHGTATVDVNWEFGYGTLEAGSYRLVKTFRNDSAREETHEVAAVFEIR